MLEGLQYDAAPWLYEALDELVLGVHELPGEQDHARILEYQERIGVPFDQRGDTLAWCACFVGAMLDVAGYPHTHKATARSYLNYGEELEEPRPGCIVVFWRESPDSWKGHVAFYLGRKSGRIVVLGGNQANGVTVSYYAGNTVLPGGFRWPTK